MPVTGIVLITYILQYIPKAFYFPKTTTEDYLQQEIGDIISIMKDSPKTLPFLYYGDEKTKKKSIRLPASCKEAHPSPACKFSITPNAPTESK